MAAALREELAFRRQGSVLVPGHCMASGKGSTSLDHVDSPSALHTLTPYFQVQLLETGGPGQPKMHSPALLSSGGDPSLWVGGYFSLPSHGQA